ncbi:MAG: ferrous iron transport protein B [Firmicutes bacterium]|jgi:ferrous iron transport protein B|nr:ferrous iron transport protein B [Bacillota bacterium]
MRQATLQDAAEPVIALAGNPNSGKTSLFNSLTHSRHHVGNWPGVTVEKREGYLSTGDVRVRVVDLPGTYSLTARSADEAIARSFILEQSPDVVVDVVDASNIQRNLYLTIQLLEMGARVVVALNMFDEARALGIQVDIPALERLLGVPVVPTVATRGVGLTRLKRVMLETAKRVKPITIDYGPEMERGIATVEDLLGRSPSLLRGRPARWLAIKLLEGDDMVTAEFTDSANPGVMEEVERCRDRIRARTGQATEDLAADRRHGFVSGVVRQAVSSVREPGGPPTLSERIDRFVLHRYFGIPLLAMVLFGTFQFTFAVSSPMVDGLGAATSWLGDSMARVMGAAGASQTLVSLVRDGIVAGVGSVLSFVPPIFMLFLGISLLEDTGYMARAAFLSDRLMHAAGLHGKSAIPMIMGFGCNVPAILAARTLDSPRDRIITILVNPFISCSARLPVYVLFAGALFPRNQGLVILSLYVAGAIIAIISARVLSRTALAGEPSTFVMELPPYRIPSVLSLAMHTWERGRAFLQKAATVILVSAVAVWAMSNLPPGVAPASAGSLMGQAGTLLAPLLRPAGFGTWEAAVALMFGLVAKEVIVGTLGVVYGAEGDSLAAAIQSRWTPLSAYAFMVMSLLYVPCVSTVVAIRRETNSLGWAIFAVTYSLGVGWAAAVAVYQVGRLLGFA